MSRGVILKLYFLIVTAVVVVGFIYYFHRVSEDYFMKSNTVLYELNSLKRNEYKIDYELLYINFYLYKSTDSLIESIKKQKELINKLLEDPFFKKYYSTSYRGLLKYKREFRQKELIIFEYLRYALPINNSILFLANSLPKVTVTKRKGKQIFLELVSNIMLLQKSSDLSFLKGVEYSKYENLLKKDNVFNQAFLNNLKILQEYYPKKISYLEKILHFKTLRTIEAVLKRYLKDTDRNVKKFQDIMIIITIIISILFMSVILLVYTLERNILTITYLAEYDQLTGFKNRVKYEKEVKNKDNITLIIFDIDRFKNINDYFGTKIGDQVLISFGEELKKFINTTIFDLDIYRFGGDEFGVVGENLTKEEVIMIVNEFITIMESKVLLKGKFDITVSVSAGISQVKPYLETADIALKEVENDLKRKYAFFKEEYNKKIENNLKKVQEIKQALANGGIIPYFQGIVDKNGNIAKYEVLCRVKANGSVKSIFPYLDVLKENKMYHQITLIMLRESLKILKAKDINLSINLSLEDVLDKEVRMYIYKNFIDPHIAQKVTFEILESEIGNYEELQEFIQFMKEKGVSFAIDDFGSGYSNFERAVRLKIDFIKIDGSLVKNIDKDDVSLSVLKTIVNFAKDNNVKTIAEFIHNKEVFEIAKKMGVDYFQGFYLHEPSPFEKL